MTASAEAARLGEPERAPANVAAYLPLMAQQQPTALAVAVAGRGGGYARLSCAELDRRCDRMAHGLVRAGIARGVRTVLMVTPSPEFYALTFALFKVGAVPVFVDPGMGIANLGRCLAEAEPEAFIGIPKAHVARVVLGWGRRTLRTTVKVGRLPLLGGWSLAQLERDAPAEPFPSAEVDEKQTAAILFTSGSTGSPKGAVYSHGIFASQVRLLRQTYGIAPGEIDLSTFPLFALFGPALGMASVVPYMDASKPATADPRRLVSALDEFSCTNLFASPALIDKLGRFCSDTGRRLPSLKRAISAGAPASMPSIARFAALLDGQAEVFTPYGATEALPVASIGSRALLTDTRADTERGAGICVGHPCDEIEVAVIPISDAAIASWTETSRLPAGEIGELVVSGPVVTERYYGRDEATALAKIVDPQTGRIWHRMGDLGKRDAEGRIWMCGRKSHRVQTPHETLFTIPCERVFDTHPLVRRTALVGVTRGGRTVPVLCIELERGAGKRRQAEVLRDFERRAASHPHTHRIRTFVFHPGFPVDVRHNAKIGREKLTAWAQERVG